MNLKINNKQKLIILFLLFCISLFALLNILPYIPEDNQEISSGTLMLLAIIVFGLLSTIFFMLGNIFKYIMNIESKTKTKYMIFTLINTIANLSDDSSKDKNNKKYKFLKKYYPQYIKDIIQFNNFIISDLNKVIKFLLNYPAASRIRVIYDLLAFAVIDNTYSKKADAFIRSFTKKLKINEKVFERIKAMFVIENDETETKSREYRFYSEYINNKKKQVNDFSYRILGVDKKVSLQEVKKAYYKLAKIYHPDRKQQANKEQIKEATEMFKKISLAYNSIIDAKK